MKRLLLFVATVLTVSIVNAVEISHFHQLGLPAKAVPAKMYFRNLLMRTPAEMTEEDIMESTLIGFDNEYLFFVEEQPTSLDDMYARINLWMYDTNKDKVEKIFTQKGEEYEDLMVRDITWLLDKQASYKDVVVSDTKQKIAVQEFISKPVVILVAEIFTGTMHSPQMTLLLYPESGKVKMLKDQMFVCVSHTLTNVLMAAEMDYAQDYIITTSTGIRSEKQPLEESEEYIIFNKQYLYPALHVYSTKGVEVGNLSLPEDEVDLLR